MFWLRETTFNISRNRLMSVLAVTTVAVGLLILGTFFLTLSNLQELAKNETQKIDIVVWLKADVTPKRRKEIFEAARVPQVREVLMVSKAQVLEEWKRKYPDIPLDDMGGVYNPFSDELRIKLKDEYMQDFFKLEDYLSGLPGVVSTKSARARNQREREPVRRLLALRRFMAIASVVSLVVLSMVILLIIHNAIRLTIFARRREIGIMELVGATPWFIRIPFLMEGVVYGLAGSAIAAALISPLYGMVSRVPLVSMLLPLSGGAILWNCALLMIATGLMFGLLGSWFSLMRSSGKAMSA